MRIALCDDDKHFLTRVLINYVKIVLNELNLQAEIVLFYDGRRLIHEFQSEKYYDIVILDIDMPYMNGKEVAKRLRVMDSTFSLVFITSYKKEVYSIFQYHVDSFISKDSEKSYFLRELYRIIKSNQLENKKSIYECFELAYEKTKRKDIIRVNLEDIFYFSCRQKIIYLHTGTKEHILAVKTFSDLLDKYIGKDFYEPCRGYIVNMRHVKCIQENEVTLDNEEKIPLSRRKRSTLMKQLREYIEKEVK